MIKNLARHFYDVDASEVSDNEIERTMALKSDSSSESGSGSSEEDVRCSRHKTQPIVSDIISTSNTSSVRRSTSATVIDNRVEYIKDILKGNVLKPMIDFDSNLPDNFTREVHYHDHDDKCNDVRCLLKKRFLNVKFVLDQMNVKLIYVKSGTTGHTFKAVSKTEPSDPNMVFAVKVVAYPKKEYYGDMFDAQRPENAELMMIKLLSHFVIRKITPHIVLPIGAFNTSITPFLNIPIKDTEKNIKKYKRFRRFVRKCRKGIFENSVSVLISEWADGGDLLEYVRTSYKNISLELYRVLFFQLLSVLAIIHGKYPSFRHNDLKANNILLQKTVIDSKKDSYKYRVQKMYFSVPEIGMQIKIWDFDFACIPGIVDNSKVSSNWARKQINVRPRKNRYYDMHFFFNTLRSDKFFPHFYSDYVPKEVVDFVHRIIPPDYREGKFVTESGRITINTEFTTPFDVLCKDPFFKKFRLKDQNI